MSTIKERAGEIIRKRYCGFDFDLIKWATECCVEAATEQDRIARQEERDRCKIAAQDALCAPCIFLEECREEMRHCKTFIRITRAIEK